MIVCFHESLTAYQCPGRIYQNPGSYFSLISVTCFGVKQQVLQQPKTIGNWVIKTMVKNTIGFAILNKTLVIKNVCMGDVWYLQRVKGNCLFSRLLETSVKNLTITNTCDSKKYNHNCFQQFYFNSEFIFHKKLYLCNYKVFHFAW